MGENLSVLEQFHYQLLGEGEKKLVFLHGLLGSGANWRRVTPSFSGSFEILLLDQRGHGRSFHPDSGYAPEDYSQDLENVLSALGWREIYLVGHSMGGRNAIHFAFKFPSRVKKLVIEDIGPDGNRESSLRIQKMLEGIPVPFDSKEKAKNFFTQTFEDKSLGMYLYSNLKQMGDGNLDWRFSLNGVYESLEKGRVRNRWEEVEGLQVPTLLIRGENSMDLSQKTFDQMLRSNTNIQGKVIEGAGHWVHFDKPEEFIKVLKNFLG